MSLVTAFLCDTSGYLIPSRFTLLFIPKPKIYFFVVGLAIDAPRSLSIARGAILGKFCWNFDKKFVWAHLRLENVSFFCFFLKSPPILLLALVLQLRAITSGVKSFNRVLGRQTEPEEAGSLREELLVFLAGYFKFGGSLTDEHHQLVAVSIKALFKAKLEASPEKTVDDFSWLYHYTSFGILKIKKQEEGYTACTLLAAVLAKIFKKHWKQFGDVATFFDSLR